MLAFWILACFVIVSAIAVVVLSNPLHSALCLVVNLVAVAGIYALLGAHFLAAVQIIVYAGAIMVLVVFVLMLLNIKSESRSLGDFALIVLAVSAALFCANMLIPLIHKHFFNTVVINSDGEGSLAGGVAEIGKRLFVDQAFLFQLTAVILLAAIVGSVMLASQRKQPGKISEDGSQPATRGNEGN